MFSYRHAFHAGNHADVLKHTLLIATLQHLTEKDTALSLVDTHAGAGLYRLDSGQAETSGEAAEGFLRLAEVAKNPESLAVKGSSAPKTIASALQAYLELVAGFSAGSKVPVYPGSPFVMQRLMRPHDRLKLFELHPTDGKLLDGHVAQLEAGRQVAVLRQDGFEGLKALLPPPSRRALVLIDPSYEIKSDYAKVSACLQDSLRRFATGTYLVWYPIIPRPEAHGLPRRLKTLAQQAGKAWLHATLSIGKSTERSAGLNASGMFVVNPPHPLRAQMQQALPQLQAALQRGNGAAWSLEAS